MTIPTPEYRVRVRSPRNGEWKWLPTPMDATLDELWVFLNPYRNGDEPAAEIQVVVMKYEPVLTWKDHR